MEMDTHTHTHARARTHAHAHTHTHTGWSCQNNTFFFKRDKGNEKFQELLSYFK